jgi:hypothetical protein
MSILGGTDIHEYTGLVGGIFMSILGGTDIHEYPWLDGYL